MRERWGEKAEFGDTLVVGIEVDAYSFSEIIAGVRGLLTEPAEQPDGDEDGTIEDERQRIGKMTVEERAAEMKEKLTRRRAAGLTAISESERKLLENFTIFMTSYGYLEEDEAQKAKTKVKKAAATPSAAGVPPGEASAKSELPAEVSPEDEGDDLDEDEEETVRAPVVGADGKVTKTRAARQAIQGLTKNIGSALGIKCKGAVLITTSVHWEVDQLPPTTQTSHAALAFLVGFVPSSDAFNNFQEMQKRVSEDLADRKPMETFGPIKAKSLLMVVK